MRKLIAVDVDGTLVDSKKNLRDRTRDSLLRALREGHFVMIVSGRQTAGLTGLAKALKFDEYGGLLSAFNGGQLTDYKEGKILANHTLEMDLAREILDFSRNLDLEMMLPYEGAIVTDRAGQKWVEFESKVLGVNIDVRDDIRENLTFRPNKFLFAQDPDRIDEPANKLLASFGHVTEQVKSSRYYYEIMPKGLSKGASLVEAAKILDVDRENVIAFGDEMNDISMLEEAGTAVAMGNAIDQVKNIADYVTKSNDEDGIAYYLENFILKGSIR